MKDLEHFKQQFEIIKDICDSVNGYEELEELECQVEMEMIAIDDTRDDVFKKLQKLRDEIRKCIVSIKKEDNNLFDPEAELDRMFPDRHNDDFDEESMSWDSIYGKD